MINRQVMLKTVRVVNIPNPSKQSIGELVEKFLETVVNLFLRRKIKDKYEKTPFDPEINVKNAFLTIKNIQGDVKGLEFSYKVLERQRYTFERADVIHKRSLYLGRIDEARRRGDCVVYMDETWVFEGMVKKRGWMDNTVSRFPSAQAIQQYSCGKTAVRNKERRVIVIAALNEAGVMPGCTHVLVFQQRTTQDGIH
ncbi:hypothetical protein OSTOST_23968, partial [Ostertagia ostertagi]